MTPTTLAAAILRDVKLYEPDWAKEPYDRSEMVESTVGDWLSRDEVLAALTAAMDPAIADRAGAVLEGVTPGPWAVRKWSQKMTITGNIHQVTDKDGHPSAFVPAWDTPGPGELDGTEEAKANARFIAWCREGVPALLTQNAALRAERDEARENSDSNFRTAKRYLDRIVAAEAQIAALTAQVEKLTGAGKDAADDWEECVGHVVAALGHKPDWYGHEIASVAGFRAALSATTEEGHE